MLNIIAFVAQAGAPTAPTAPSGAEVFAALIPAMIMLLVGIGISVLVCYLLYTAQQAIPPQFQRIPPGQVWLLLIPLFNLVWNFFVYLRIPESYQSYFYSMGRTDVGDAGKSLGLWFAICAACTVVPCVGIFAALAALVLLIIFLVKITGLKNQALQMSGGGGTGGFPMHPPPQV